MDPGYDVIIVGASFAGLAVARQIRGRMLVIDRIPLGTEQSSACGTLIEVPVQLGAMDAVLQTFDAGYIHTPDLTITYRLPYEFCTLDYQRFCAILADQADFTFLQASVLNIEGNRVHTSRGSYQGHILVDASGWRAALGHHLDSTLVDRRTLSFGLESELPLRGQGLYFWVDPAIMQRGVGWDFPCGSTSRLGVGSYAGQSAVGPLLEHFTTAFIDHEADHRHGGFFTSSLRRGRIGQLFLVGDAAGQCLPLTGEGIRPALYFGQECGMQIQKVLDGNNSLEEALRTYDTLVEGFRPAYRVLKLLQDALSRLPPWALLPILRAVSSSKLCDAILFSYRSTTPGRVLQRSARNRQSSSSIAS